MKNSNAEIIAAAVYEENPQIQAALLGKLSSFDVAPALIDQHMHALAEATEELCTDAQGCKGIGNELKGLGIFDGGLTFPMSEDNAPEVHSASSGPSL